MSEMPKIGDVLFRAHVDNEDYYQRGNIYFSRHEVLSITIDRHRRPRHATSWLRADHPDRWMAHVSAPTGKARLHGVRTSHRRLETLRYAVEGF